MSTAIAPPEPVAPATPVTPAVGTSNDVQIGQDLLAQIDVPQDKLKAIGLWLVSEIDKAKGERADLESRLAEWERLYEARPLVKTKTEPWVGASNLIVPVIATAADAVLARVLNAVFGGKKLWTGIGKSAKWVGLANPMEDWLDWVGKEVLHMYRFCQSWFLSMVKTGTGIAKMPWVKRVRNVMYKDAKGAVVNEPVVIHDGPLPENVPLADFFFSSDALITNNIQYCEWIAHRTVLTWKQIKERETSGIFFDVDRIKTMKRSDISQAEAGSQAASGVQPSEYNDYELWEFWASYDVNEDGIAEEVLVTLEPLSGTVLRAVYNFYRHQERPFHVIRYMPRDNNLLAIGICQMLMDIQEEITTIHNQRLDNATIANTRAWKRRKGTTLEADEIYPGAFIDVDDMDDIEELKLGDIYPSLLAEELHTNAIGEKRTGVSDYTVGRESQAIGSRATATSTLALIQEGNKRFQMTIRDIREALTDMAHQTIMLYQQFAINNQVMYEIFDEKEKAIVMKYFQMPIEYTKANIAIDTPAISETANKEIAQQTMLTLMGVVREFYEGMMEAFALATNPQAPEQLKALAIQGASAGSQIWKKVLEAFDFRDADTFVPDVEALLGFGQAAEMLGGQNELGAAGGPTGNVAPGVQQPPVGDGAWGAGKAGIVPTAEGYRAAGF